MTAQPTYAPDGYRPTAPSPLQARPTAPRPTPPRTSRRRTGRTVAVLGALLVVLAGLGAAAMHLLAPATVETATVRNEIVRVTRDAVGVAPTDVRCPEGILAQAGATFTCTGTVDGQPVTWWVRQVDDRGGLAVTADRLLRRDTLEQTVATRVGADLRTTVTVDCGPADRTVLRNTPGQEIDCTATDPTDPTDVTRLTVTLDENGTLAYRLR
jgi:uncharacterized protein DUF4333